MARPITNSATYARTTLRLPSHVFEAIQEQADQSRRPVNTEMVLLLCKALGISDRQKREEEQHELVRA